MASTGTPRRSNFSTLTHVLLNHLTSSPSATAGTLRFKGFHGPPKQRTPEEVSLRPALVLRTLARAMAMGTPRFAAMASAIMLCAASCSCASVTLSPRPPKLTCERVEIR